jgi:hypothetical protein
VVTVTDDHCTMYREVSLQYKFKHVCRHACQGLMLLRWREASVQVLCYWDGGRHQYRSYVIEMEGGTSTGLMLLGWREASVQVLCYWDGGTHMYRSSQRYSLREMLWLGAGV